jgi:hypothetical protein
MNHAGRHRWSGPRHVWEDGAFSVALGWIVKRETEQPRRTALERRARPVQRRRSTIVSALVLGSVALLSVWGLSRPRLEAAWPVQVSLSDEIRQPSRMAGEAVNRRPAPEATPLAVQNTAQSMVPDPPPGSGKTRRQLTPRNVAASSTPSPTVPASTLDSPPPGVDGATTSVRKAVVGRSDQDPISASPRPAASDNQATDGTDIVDWFIKELPRRR